MPLPVRQWYTFAEYVDLEEGSPVRHEFLDGQVRAQAGGSPEHAAIAANVLVLLTNQLRGRPCRVFTSDLRIRSTATGLATYADVTVVCGRLELDPDDQRGHTVVNPRVLVEVLSPSTERYDRGEKLDHYRGMGTVEEVVLVFHDERRVDVWRRDAEDWTQHTARGEGAAELRSVGCTLALEEVYRDPLRG